ncbi:hypothetical protein LOTGIDRAFT_153656 [Lottia gigantea]|uniref:PH domain-containing protein n=1 Tax=Lottia gigantea TaxID=225164 RepID=V4AD18_LOTGI|nr:hypothetical protein LOTGIDRAFT_153656 [Lottia gigantea]ESO91226.1 hypothetical protein LOTGIDRAFT_153656 [Lottia gigantea]
MDKENHSLREGFLLVQNISKKWKVRWFILEEETLSCFHKRKRNLMIEIFPLKGCAIVCPCTDEPELNPQCLVKLCIPTGEEIMLLTAGVEDRDGWAHAIGAVLRSLTSSEERSPHKMPFRDFRAYANVSEIIGAIQEPGAGIETSTHVRGSNVYKNCFKGSDIVDWLMRWSIVRNRGNGAAMAQTLLKLGHFQEVDLHDGSGGVSTNFHDNDKLYRFTSINLGAKRNSYYDSTDSESSSSEEEDEGEKDEQKERLKKGKTIKEAFLLKKRTLRKGWKVIKATLRDNPAHLQYQKAAHSVVSDNKAGTIMYLENGTITESSKPPVDKGGLGRSKGARYRVYIKDGQGKSITLQYKDEQESCEWLPVLKTSTASSKPDNKGNDKPTLDG